MNQRLGGIGVLLGFAGVFLLLRRFIPSMAKVFLILGILAALCVAALVAAVVFLAFRKPKKTPEQQAAHEASATLQQGRSRLMQIRRLSMKLKHPEIRSVSETICTVLEKILRVLKEQPEDVPRVSRFFHYYLPTLQSVLTKYTRLESHGIPARETAEKTLAGLKDLQAAMERQYLNLFEGEKLDLSVEMAVLTQICRRDGLLEDDVQLPEMPQAPDPAVLREEPEFTDEVREPDFTDELQEDGGSITLTL